MNLNKAKEMYGKIGFDHLKIKCIIGVLPDERVNEQEIYVDLRVEVSFAEVALSDQLTDSIDYVKLANLCYEIAKVGKFQMIETYATAVLKQISSIFILKSAWIRIKKPQALPSAAAAIVELSI